MGNRETALALAASGIAVFPCYAGGEQAKRPLRGVYWRKQSTTDARQIERWWNADPDAVPAIDLAKAGRLVIDCDAPVENGDPDGVAWFRGFATPHELDIDEVPGTISWRGGRHLFFRAPADMGNGRGSLPPKKECAIDVRGAGGYVIAPGAVMEDGRQYQPAGDIAEAPELPAWLEEVLRGSRTEAGVPISAAAQGAAPRSLRSTVAPAGDDPFRAINDLAMSKLGQWVPAIFGSAAKLQSGTGAYRISSRSLGRKLQEDLSIAPTGIVDFGVHDMGDARDGRRTPIDVVMEHGRQTDAVAAMMWLCEALGVDPASIGFGQTESTIDGAAVARRLLQQDDGTIIDQDTGEVIEDTPEAGEFPAHLLRPPGLVGDIAQWISDTARRPQPALSLGAALAVVGTAAGRQIAGPTLSGTHLYVVALGPTGSGKDHPLQQTAKLLRAAKMGHHVGPSEFTTMPAVINFLVRSPLSLCAMDEFGAFLKRMNARHASGFERSISKVLRTAWGCSFQTMMTPEWAGRETAQIIAPSLSLFGASTEEEFYGALESADQENGVINRFLIVATHHRPSERDPKFNPFEVPMEISTGLRAIYNRAGELAAAQRNAASLEHKATALAWGEQARDIYEAFGHEIEARGDADPIERPFLARSVEMALRIATIIAVGRASLTVDDDDMIFGRDLAVWSAGMVIRGAREHMAETETQAEANRIVRTLRAAGGKMKRQDLLKAMKHRLRARDLNDLLKAMIEAESILEIQGVSAGGRPPIWYAATS